MCADVDEYESIGRPLKLKVVAPKDGCKVERAELRSDQSVAILPIDGGAKQGFTIVDSSKTDIVIATAKCPPPPPVDTAARARPVKFHTKSLKANGTANQIVHKVKWDSSSGSLADLEHLKTREDVSWSEGVPHEFRPCPQAPEYERPGSHNGHGPSSATFGSAEDVHSIVPPNACLFKGQREDGSPLANKQKTSTWVQKQVYQYGKPEGDNQLPWQAQQHPNNKDAEYTLERWAVRKGKDLVIHMTKKAVNERDMFGRLRKSKGKRSVKGVFS